MVPMSANLFGPTSSKRIGKVSVNTLLPSVNSLAAQWGTCSIAFFASSSSLIEEAAPAFVLVVFLSRLPLVLLLSFLLLLFGMNDDGEDDDEVEEVIMQRVEGAVVIEEVKLIFFFYLFATTNLNFLLSSCSVPRVNTSTSIRSMGRAAPCQNGLIRGPLFSSSSY